MTKITSEMMSRALTALGATYPVVLKREPLVIGCGPQLDEVLYATGFSRSAARAILTRYFRHDDYLNAMKAGVARWHLDGSASDQLVTAEQAQAAQEELASRKAKYIAKRRAERKAHWAARKAAKKAEKPVPAPQAPTQPVAEKAAPAAPAVASRVGLGGRPILSLRRSA